MHQCGFSGLETRALIRRLTQPRRKLISATTPDTIGLSRRMHSRLPRTPTASLCGRAPCVRPCGSHRKRSPWSHHSPGDDDWRRSRTSHPRSLREGGCNRPTRGRQQRTATRSRCGCFVFFNLVSLSIVDKAQPADVNCGSKEACLL